MQLRLSQLLSDDAVIENKDLIVFNLYGSYTVDKLTYKAMYVSGDGEAGENDEDDAFLVEDSYNVGADYQHTQNLKLFTDYFFKENGCAIYTRKAENFTPLSSFKRNQMVALYW